MSVVAFDPAITHTGAACVSDDGRELRGAPLIRVEGENRDLQDRLTELRRDVRAFLEEHRPKVVAVEMPAKRGLPPEAQGFKKRSMLHLPTYGIAVGTVLAEAERYVDMNPNREVVVLCRGSDEWSRGYPGTKNDEYKTARVRLVESMFQLPEGSLGAKTTAGNLADAILLATHAAQIATANLATKGAAR
jgi:hypothetical protein